jgi:hypothetical protein
MVTQVEIVAGVEKRKEKLERNAEGRGYKLRT